MLRRKYGMQAGNIIGTGSFIPKYQKPDPQTGQSVNATPFWGVGASGAEVEVDTETGHFKITKLVNVADVGMPINPKLLKVQLSGAGIMQLGFTTTEEMIFRDGQLTNGSLADYKIPTLLDLPAEFINEHVELEAARRSVWRQRRRGKHDDRAFAGDRQCVGRRGRHSSYRSASHAGKGLPRPATGQGVGRRMT